MADTNKNPPRRLKSNQSLTLNLCDAGCQLVLSYQNMDTSHKSNLSKLETASDTPKDDKIPNEIYSTETNEKLYIICTKIVSSLEKSTYLNNPNARGILLRRFDNRRRNQVPRDLDDIYVDLTQMVFNVARDGGLDEFLKVAINDIPAPNIQDELKQSLEEYELFKKKKEKRPLTKKPSSPNEV